MFLDKLRAAWERADSLVCVGLDPDPVRFPAPFAGTPDEILAFNRAIIDGTHDLVCAYKPQIAHYAAVGAEAALEGTIAYLRERCPEVPVILDAKRGDIGSTAAHYAREAFERYGADAVTVNPYLGGDSLEPFLRYGDRGVVILCRTSNPGAADFQDLELNGRPLYEHIAEAAATRWNGAGNCLLVVGATWPEQLARVRALVGEMPLLVPGVGSQGGDARAVVEAGATVDGRGLVVNSSRGVLYAYQEQVAAGEADAAQTFVAAARAAVLGLREELNAARRAP